MSVAAANSWFSALVSPGCATSSHSLSSNRLFCASRRPYLLSASKSSKDVNQNPVKGKPKKSLSKSAEKEAVLQKFPSISRDGSSLSNADGRSTWNKTGRSQLTSYKSSGLQRKANKGLLVDSTKQQLVPLAGAFLAEKLENPALRTCLKVPTNEGVLVRKVEPTSHATSALKEGDVIVSFDNVRVGCEGMVPFRSTERIAFRYLISQKFTGGVANIGIIRGGQFMEVQVVLNPRVHLVPYHIEGGQPSYLIVAGLVFTPLSEPLIEEECEDSIGLKLLAKARYSMAKFKGEQIVILSQVLANEENIGYEDMSNEQVLKLNGTWIRNIHHLAHLVDSCKDKYLVFEFDDNFLVVLERESALAASTSILKGYGIRSERSSDLLEPYVNSILQNEGAMDQHQFGDSPVSNSEFGYDGLLWA